MLATNKIKNIDESEVLFDSRSLFSFKNKNFGMCQISNILFNHITGYNYNWMEQFSLDTLNRKIIIKNGFYRYFSDLGFLDLIVPNVFIGEFIRTEPYYFLINWLRESYKDHNQSPVVQWPINSIYSRYNELYSIFEDNIRKVGSSNNKKFNICLDYYNLKLWEIDYQIRSNTNFNILDNNNNSNNNNNNKKLELDAFIFFYKPGKDIGGFIEHSFKLTRYYRNVSKKRPIFYLIGIISDPITNKVNDSFKLGKELADILGADIFFEISKENYKNDRWIHFLLYQLYTENNYSLKIKISTVLKELNYTKKTLFSSNQININNVKITPMVYHIMLELIFLADLPIFQFIKDIKSSCCNHMEILKFFKKEIIELNCLIYKIKSFQLNKNHQHILSINKRKQTLYRNFKKLFIYSKIENYLELIKALSPIYSHNLETTNYIKIFFNDKTMYSNRNFENLLQDISWCGDIIIRVTLIGDLDLIQYYRDINDNFVNYSNSCKIVDLKNNSLTQ
ncbi:hypothetical protein ACTA71_009550 [Dictyostelium dimigraforme]